MQNPPQATQPKPPGTLRLFGISGIEVFVHWSWALVALVQIQLRERGYSTALWAAVEYLALFAIVTAHEFGHAFACRSVGGRADRIVLWPLGGVAYVTPPERPGAHLWSIAAGPLVNVVLVPITLGASYVFGGHDAGDFGHFVRRIAIVNIALLVFNLLPVYPLDGGQILRSLLWYAVGRARSLWIAAIVGFVGAGALGAFALYSRSMWLGVLAYFNITRARVGYKAAQSFLAVERAPRRETAVCVHCQEPAPVGLHWVCPCGSRFDTFEANGACPSCHRRFANASCPLCHTASPLASWDTRAFGAPAAVVPPVEMPSTGVPAGDAPPGAVLPETTPPDA